MSSIVGYFATVREADSLLTFALSATAPLSLIRAAATSAATRSTSKSIFFKMYPPYSILNPSTLKHKLSMQLYARRRIGAAF
jgi:hypothetical protein